MIQIYNYIQVICGSMTSFHNKKCNIVGCNIFGFIFSSIIQGKQILFLDKEINMDMYNNTKDTRDNIDSTSKE